MGVFETLRQRLGGARNGDQMHVVRHETVAQQRKFVQF